MPAPLPPVVNGPIYAVPGAQVGVDNLLPNAFVRVFQNGSEVGHATSDNPGFLWVPTTVALVVGRKITAKQTYTGTASYVQATPGVESPASNFAVTVAAVPKSLPTPVFLSGINQCSNSVWLGGLVPGATVSVFQGANHLGGGLAQFPSQWFSLTGPEPAPGQALEAQQTYQKRKSPIGSSSLVAPEPKSLGKPGIALPARDCQTFLDFSGMTPGANVEVTNGGFVDTGTSPAVAYTADLQPLKAGQLTAWQYFARCENVPPSPKITVTVSNRALPRPKVGYALCATLRQLTVTNLLPGEILTVSAVTQSGGGTKTVTVLGPQGVSTKSATVFLPALPADTVALRLSVTLCGLEEAPSPHYVTVPVSTAAGPSGPPSLVKPLYDCARFVTVTGAYPGCLLTVFSGLATNVLAAPVVAAASEVVIPLWTALTTGEKVSVKQTGCNAKGQSKPATVIAPPKTIPVPLIAKPVLSDAKTVNVTGALPGAQVFLYVSGLSRSQVDALGSAVSLPIGQPALTGNEYLQVAQELCGKLSKRSDSGPGYAQVQTPAPRPSGGLKGNSGYFFEDSCNKLVGVNIKITVSQEIGGSGSAFTGFGFQLNCWSHGQKDVNAWQQFAIIVDAGGPSSPGITALANSWPYNWNGSAGDFLLDQLVTLAPPLSTSSLPANYQLTISLNTETTTDNVTSAVFQVTDLDTGTAYPSQTITMIGLPDNLTPGNTIKHSDLAPIAAFQLLLVGPLNAAQTKLSTGAGTFSISAQNQLTATNAVPTGCTQFDSPGTAENANSVYGELPSSPSQTFVQQFSVS